jgi:ABC-type uncharacterized transport system fused permease/ATPase subunit
MRGERYTVNSDANASLGAIRVRQQQQCRELQERLTNILVSVRLPQFAETIKEDIREALSSIHFAPQSNGLDTTSATTTADLSESNDISPLTESLIYANASSDASGKHYHHRDTPKRFRWRDELSPGEQQRISLARALLKNPEMVYIIASWSTLYLILCRCTLHLLIGNLSYNCLC